MRFLPVNLSSLIVELRDLDETLALFDALSASPLTGIEEIIPAARTLMIRFRPGLTDAKTLAQHIQRCDLAGQQRGTGRTVTIPVDYQGEDLPEVAEKLGISVQEVIRRHTENPYTVAFVGFAPGFAYMVSKTAQLHVPRRSTPRTKIPAGSVALAGEFSGIYPQASPGGWQIIGQTPLKMWDIERNEPALLLPGSNVHFVDMAASKVTVSLPSEMPKIDALSLTEPGTALTVISPGLLTLFQDLGRAGQASVGISESGAMDKSALRTANRIVGNPSDTPCLEITQGGFKARAEGLMVVAVSGAPCKVRIKTAQGERIETSCYQPFELCDGDEIALTQPVNGVRSYLAVRGGFIVSPSLGSCSFDTLAQVGPAPLQTGDRIAVAPVTHYDTVSVNEWPPAPFPAAGEIVTLDIVLGPRTDWFTEEAMVLLTAQLWQVTPQSNRIGLRLAGEQTLTRLVNKELPSEGTCIGAIQVPASGQPVLFLNDHPLTGGYPVIAAVADYHLDLAGQIPVGAMIRFNPVRQFLEIKGSDAAL